jgi:hypothetical protein
MTQVVNFKGQHGGAAKGCLIAAIILILLAAGGGWLMWNKVTGMMGEELTRAIQDDPAIQEHIGTIEEAKLNLMATGKRPENQNKGSDGKQTVMVFDVQGSKGKGRVIAQIDGGASEGSAEMFQSATLDMGGGKTYPISVNGKAPAPEQAPAPTPESAPEAAPEPAGAGAGK